MKKLYIFLVLGVLLVNQFTAMAVAFQQVSTSCVDTLRLRDSDIIKTGYGDGEALNDSIIPKNTTGYVQVSISYAAAIEVFVDIEPGGQIKGDDRLEIFKGAIGSTDSRKVFTNGANTDERFIIEDSIITIAYTNGDNGEDEVDITWQGILGTSLNVQHNCTNGAADGSIEIDVDAGVEPYTYQWGGGQTSSIIKNKAAGLYTYTVTDAKGCITTEDVTIFEPSAALDVDEQDKKDACYGSADGKITLVPSGGYLGSLLDYKYKWHDGPETSTRSDLAKGIYSYTVTDSIGCVFSDSIIIRQPTAALSASLAITHEISCHNSNGSLFTDGAIEVTANGGTASYTYDWGSGYVADDSIPDLGQGSYNCTVKDDNGCTLVSNSVTLNEPSALSVPAVIDQEISCNSNNIGNKSNGKISVTATGGTGLGTYAYDWDDGNGFVSNNSISSLSQDVYNCIVQDANGCQKAISPVTLNEPIEIIAAVITDNTISCHANNVNGAVNNSDAQLHVNVTNLGARTITDYDWGTATRTQIIQDLGAGSYTCTVTDNLYCKAISNTVALNEPDELVATAAVVDNISCHLNNVNGATATNTDAEIRVDVANLGTRTIADYDWSAAGNGQILTNKGAGDYICVATDNLGCIVTSNTLTLTEPDEFIANASIVDSISCHANNVYGTATNTDAEIRVDVANLGARTIADYDWGAAGTGQILSNKGFGAYTCTVTDNFNCIASSNILTLSEPDELVAIANIDIEISCHTNNGINNDGELSVDVTGGTGAYLYNWGDGDKSYGDTVVSEDTYTCTITDAKGCIEESTTVSPAEPNEIIASNSDTSNYKGYQVSCFGVTDGWAEISATGGNVSSGYTYLWDASANNQSTFRANNLAEGTYSYTISDDYNCEETGTFTLDAPGALDIIGTVTDVDYDGGNNGAITINNVGDVVGATTYTWTGIGVTPNQQNQIGLEAGLYMLSIEDENHCIDSKNFEVKEPSLTDGGEIVLDQTDFICYSVPQENKTFSNTTAAFGGVGTINYTWQLSLDKINWVEYGDSLTVANGGYNTNDTVGSDIYIRRVANDGAKIAYSNQIQLKYLPDRNVDFYNLGTSYCENGDSVLLVASKFDGLGVFSGLNTFDNGDGTAYFKPNAINIIAQTNGNVVYNYTEEGCVSTKSKPVTINITPNPNFVLGDKYSNTIDSVEITGITPAGGVFSGQGIATSASAAHLLPSKLTAANYNISYTATLGSCSKTFTKKVEIVEGSGIIYLLGTTIEPSYFCYDGDTVYLEASTSEPVTKGVFGSFITTVNDTVGYFVPKKAFDAGYTAPVISYDYETTSGNDKITKTIEIFNVEDSAAIYNLDTSYCQYSGQLVEISAKELTNGDAGRFELSNGLFANNDTITLDINSLTASSTVPYALSYIYTHNNITSNCKDTATRSFYVHALTPVSFEIKDTFNVEESPVQITVFSPAASTFSGNGITDASGTFNPGSAGVGSATITITYTNPTTTCVSTVDSIVYVDEPSGQFKSMYDLNNIYCYKGEPDTIYVTTTNGRPGGVFSIDGVTLTSIDTIGTDSLIIYPNKYGKNITKTITYTYQHSTNETYFTLQTSFYIDDLGILGIKGLNDTYCEYNSSSIIQGLVGGAVSSKGELSGISGATTDISTDDGKAIYTPFDLPELPVFIDSIADTVSFIYKSPVVNSNCTDTYKQGVVIYNTPAITLSDPLKAIYNKNGGVDTIAAVPLGGVFSGDGVTLGNVVTYNPGSVSLGSASVNYYYMDDNSGCSRTITQNTDIQEAQGIILNVDNSYCYSNENNIVTVSGLNLGNVTGNFSGSGIIDNLNKSAILNPKLVYDAVGSSESSITDTIKYEFYVKKDGDSARFELKKTFVVNNVSAIEFIVDEASKEVCTNEAIIDLSKMDNHDNAASYSIVGSPIPIVDGIFNPHDFTEGEYTIKYEFTDNSCTTTLNDQIIVHEPVSPNFNIASKLCDEDTITLVGEPLGGYFEATASLIEIEDRTDSVYFVANTASNVKISYIYNDANTCTDTIIKNQPVYSKPVLSFPIDLPDMYCYNASKVTINGLSGGNTVNTGLFYSDEALTNAINTNDGKYSFLPADYEPETYIIYFKYTDNNTCSNVISNEFDIKALKTILIDADDEYCPYTDVSGSYEITGTPTLEPNHPSSDGFRLPNGSQSLSKIDFVASSYPQNTVVPITYTQTDENGCTNSLTKNVRIKNLPSIDFTYSNQCIARPIQFAYGSSNGSYLTPVDSIAKYLWDFGDETTDSVSNVEHEYKFPDNYDIFLSVTNIEGCITKKVKPLYMDRGPIANFGWDLECAGSKVQFTNTTNKLGIGFEWKVDGVGFSNAVNPSYTFNEPGNHTIELIATESGEACFDDTTKSIYIRPIIQLSESESYTNSFEDDYSGWAGEVVSGSVLPSWENVFPVDTAIINYAIDGSKIWVTNASGKYNDGEQSAITSPCFDLSSMKKPMVDFWYWADALNGPDGGVLQYRLENDTIWNELGKPDEAIGWYNYNAILGSPGGESQLNGWTGNTEGWVHAQHDLNDLLGANDLVRFRLAFACNTEAIGDGFAFDNFTIRERSRRILVEHFTNSKETTALGTNKIVNDLVGVRPLDAIDIQYHTGFPEGDPFYMDYPSGPMLRSVYYNVSGVPYAIINGDKVLSFSNKNSERVDDMLNLAMSVPEFGIDLDIDISGLTVSISNKIKALSTIENKQLQLFNAIVEKEVNVGSITYENVLRSFVPSVSGEYLAKNWSSGDSVEINYTYNIDNFINSDELTVITYIQDELTKEILQVATTDTTSISIPSAIDNLFSGNNHFDFKIFPNPATNITNILFSAVTDEECVVRITNQQGQLIDVLEVASGNRLVQVNTNSYQEGIYLISYQTKDEQIVKKLMILK